MKQRVDKRAKQKTCDVWGTDTGHNSDKIEVTEEAPNGKNGACVICDDIAQEGGHEKSIVDRND